MDTLLLVEDDPDFATLVTLALQDAYALDHVDTLRAAIAALERRRYAGILCDLTLPDSRGLGTVYHLLLHGRGLPIVAWTAAHGAACTGQGYVVLDKTALDWATLGDTVRQLLGSRPQAQ